MNCTKVLIYFGAIVLFSKVFPALCITVAKPKAKSKQNKQLTIGTIHPVACHVAPWAPLTLLTCNWIQVTQCLKNTVCNDIESHSSWSCIFTSYLCWAQLRAKETAAGTVLLVEGHFHTDFLCPARERPDRQTTCANPSSLWKPKHNTQPTDTWLKDRENWGREEGKITPVWVQVI